MNKYVLLVAVIALVSQAQGSKPELRLFNTRESYSLTFTGPADLTGLGSVFGKFNRVCSTGIWYAYTDVDFDGGNNHFGNFGSKDKEWCQDFDASKDTMTSIRHLGADDTTTNAITLFSESYFRKEALVVTLRAKTDITMPVASIIGTGTADWMLFEGPGLNGKSACLSVPNPNEGIWYTSVTSPLYMPIKTVRSVFRGCDLEEIEAYRKINSL